MAYATTKSDRFFVALDGVSIAKSNPVIAKSTEQLSEWDRMAP